MYVFVKNSKGGNFFHFFTTTTILIIMRNSKVETRELNSIGGCSIVLFSNKLEAISIIRDSILFLFFLASFGLVWLAHQPLAELLV